VLAEFATYLAGQGYAPTSVRVIVGTVRLLAAAAGVEPVALSRAHLEAYYQTRPLAPQTRHKYADHLRCFARWAGLPDPTDGLRLPPVPRRSPRPVSEDDLQRMLGAARGRERAWVLLGAYAGLRSFETAKVAGRDLEASPAGPVLRVRGKGGRVDVLPLPGVLAAELRWWRRREGEGRLWPGASAGVVQGAIRGLAERAGVPGVTSHMLRHRYGTAVYAASADLLLTQRLMRHASPATTAGYAAVADARAAAAVRSLPGAGVAA